MVEGKKKMKQKMRSHEFHNYSSTKKRACTCPILKSVSHIETSEGINQKSKLPEKKNEKEQKAGFSTQ